MKNLRRAGVGVHDSTRSTSVDSPRVVRIQSDLEKQLVEAATVFATRVASAVEKHQSSDVWVDQDSCHPISRRKFLDLIATGKLSARREGKQRLVRRRDLDRYIERHERRLPTRTGPLTDAQFEARLLTDLELTAKPTMEES